MATSTTSPNPSAADQASPSPQSPSVDSIGASFVSQYYNCLIKDPSKLHKYYKSESRFSYVNAHGQSFTAHGQDAIKKCLADLQLSECKARVCGVECQDSLNGSVIIVVEGFLSNKGSPMKRFIQTFLLAAQTMGYYVLNDIFRYILEDTESKADESVSSPSPVQAAAAAIPPSSSSPAPAAPSAEQPSPTPAPVVEVAPAPVQSPPASETVATGTTVVQEAVEAPEGSEADSTAATGGTTSGGSVKSDEFESEHDDSKKRQSPPQSRPLPSQQRPKDKDRREKRRKQEVIPSSAPSSSSIAADKTSPPAASQQETVPPKSAWNVPSSVATSDTVSAENPTPKEASRRRPPSDRNVDKTADKAKDTKPAVISSYAAAVGTSSSSDKTQHAEADQQQAPVARQERERPDPRKQTGTSSGSEQPPTAERRSTHDWHFDGQRRTRSFDDAKFELFIGGLPKDATDDELRTLFSPCGKILRLNNKASERSYAFLIFETQDALDAALKLNPTLRGVTLKVDLSNKQQQSHQKSPRPSGSGRDMTKRDGFDRERRFERREGGFPPRKDGSNSARERYPRRDEPAPPSPTENGGVVRDRDSAHGPADRRPGPGFRGGPRNRFGSREFGRGFNRPLAPSSAAPASPSAASPAPQQTPAPSAAATPVAAQ